MDYPKFKSDELSTIVKELMDVNKKLEVVKELETRRKSLEKKLRDNTLFWLIYHEFQVRYHNGFKEVDEWFYSFSVTGSKRYGGEFLETRQEAMEQLGKSKQEISNMVGERVVLPYNSRGIIVGCNITWARVYKGGADGLSNPNKMSYEEISPSNVIIGR